MKRPDMSNTRIKVVNRFVEQETHAPVDVKQGSDFELSFHENFKLVFAK